MSDSGYTTKEEHHEIVETKLNYIADDILSQARHRYKASDEDQTGRLEDVAEAIEYVEAITTAVDTGEYEQALKKAAGLQARLKKLARHDRTMDRDMFSEDILKLKVQLELLNIYY